MTDSIEYKFLIVTSYHSWTDDGKLWPARNVWVFAYPPREVTERFNHYRLSYVEYEADKARIDAELADFYKRAEIDLVTYTSEEERQEIIASGHHDILDPRFNCTGEYTNKLYLQFDRHNVPETRFQ